MAVAEGYDVRLGGVDLVLRPGSYRKRTAPTFGARFATGDPSWRDLSFWQHHAQSDWIGGMGAETFNDPAMYDKGVGLDTSRGKEVRLSRGLTAVVLPTGAVTTSPLNFVETPAGLFAWQGFGTGAQQETYIWKYVEQGGGVYNSSSWVRKDNVYTRQYAGAGLSPFRAAYAAYGNGKIYFFGTHNSTPVNAYASSWSFDPVTFAWYPALLNGANQTWGQPIFFNNYVWVFQGNQLACYSAGLTNPFALTVRSGWTNAVWQGADVVPCAEISGGYLWFMSGNGRIGRCDGATFSEYWKFDAGIQGVSMKAADGRIVVGTYEWVDDPATGQAAIYMMSGSALTQLKRWGKPDKANVIADMAVHDRRVFYSAGLLFGFDNGFGVAQYDPAEDAHSFYATSCDTATYPDTSGVGTDWIVDSILFVGGYMYASVRKYGIFRTLTRYMDVADGTARYDISRRGGTGWIDSKLGGWLESGDFDAGTPGLQKQWRYVLVNYEATSVNVQIQIDYSLDGGLTWAVAGQETYAGATKLRTSATFRLPDTAQSARFKYRLTLRSSDATVTPVITAVVVSYVPIPEPNWQWEFIGVVSDTTRLSTGEVVEEDVSQRMADLETMVRTSGGLTTFTDIDGVSWEVLVTDFNEDVATARSPEEAAVRFVLVEANPS